MIIRKARVADVDRIAKMNLDLLKMHNRFDERFQLKKGALKLLKEHMRKKVYSNNVQIYVAEDQDVIGFMVAKIEKNFPAFKESQFGHIGATYVEKKYRKSGLGRKLLDNSIEWLKGKGVKNVALHVHEKNAIGLGAWEKLGFKNYMQMRSRKI